MTSYLTASRSLLLAGAVFGLLTLDAHAQQPAAPAAPAAAAPALPPGSPLIGRPDNAAAAKLAPVNSPPIPTAADKLPVAKLNAVGAQDRQHPVVGVKRERRTLAQRQQAGDRIDLAIGQHHTRDRRVTKQACGRMQPRRGHHLLAQIRRSIDQIPMDIISADGD